MLQDYRELAPSVKPRKTGLESLSWEEWVQRETVKRLLSSLFQSDMANRSWQVTVRPYYVRQSGNHDLRYSSRILDRLGRVH